MNTDSIHSSASLATGFGEVFAGFVRKMEQLPPGSFEQQTGDKWSPGQHLDHLIRSTKPLNLALRVPKFYLRWQFGTPNRPGRTYEEVIAKYQSALEKGGKASGRFVPPPVPEDQRDLLLARFRKEGNRLVDVTARWSEKNLDSYLLPHPLLGKMTVREMLFFTHYHTGHHAGIIERDFL